MRSRYIMCVALLLGSCATTPPARITWTEPTSQARPGVIESVTEIAGDAEDVASNATHEALLGLIVGGLVFSNLLFDRGTAVVVGAETGTTLIAGPAGVPTTLPRYQVLVRFDDGGSMTLVYTGDVRFHRGERVMLTQQGLVDG